MLQCNCISKRFANSDVLNGVSMTINEGEFVAIMGKSGAGKSTLLNIMAGLESPTAGDIIYHGLAFSKCSSDELAKIRLRNFGFIFQFYNLISELTVYENLLVPFELDKRRISKESVMEILSQLSISEKINNYPYTLSGGEQQRVAIARAILMKPKIIFADEPTGNLDEKATVNFLSLIGDINKNDNTTIILVTHDIRVADCAKRVIYLSDGKIVNREEVNNNEG